MMGEHIRGDIFRIADLTVQSTNNSRASFLRLADVNGRYLDAFFKKTGFSYTRYNYLGEWHSHPGFAVQPSGADIAAMRAIVDNESIGANFAVLLIARLSAMRTVDVGSWLFVPNTSHFHQVDIELEPQATSSSESRGGRLFLRSTEQFVRELGLRFRGTQDFRVRDVSARSCDRNL